MENSPHRLSLTRSLLHASLFVLLVNPSIGATDQAGSYPEASRIATAPSDQQRVLLSPLDQGDVSGLAAYKMSETEAGPYPDIMPKVGGCALKFSADAERGGAKGDFSIAASPEGETQALGMWVYLEDDSNVNGVGFQIYDAEGEALLNTTEVSGTGWQWVEMDLQDDSFKPAYSQKDKNGKIDQPLKGVHIVWHSAEAGPTSLGVDALTSLTKLKNSGESLRVQTITAPWGEPGNSLTGALLIHNFLDQEQTLSVQTSLQTNSQYLHPALPDPDMGSDHAQGRSSWTVINNERVEDSSLTDGEDDTCLTPAMPKGGYTEIFQVVDLGRVRNVVAIETRPGDGNWIRRIDIAASPGGTAYSPIDGLQNIDLKGHWDFVRLNVPRPFDARYLRIRYHDQGDALPGHFRTLSSIHVYDGIDDESFAIPTVGESIDQQTMEVRVPPRTFRIVPMPPSPPLGSGAYQLGILYEEKGRKHSSLADYFVMPEGDVEIRPDSRFGMNVNSPRYIPEIVRAGFGWIRFENMKWPFYNPAPDDFRFDGSVGPWYVPFDRYYEEYRKANLSILPYIFETPKWATSAPDAITKNRKRYPPKNLEDYGKAIFQAVARYGSRKVATDKLLTPDKLTGLNAISTYELWNEPNLTAPDWGFFVGPLDEFYRLYRAGVEGLKAANPEALASNGGWAGVSMEWIDTMHTFTYEDGKTPLDLTDVLSVHYYTGKQVPEQATRDPNANRTGKGEANSKLLETYLIDLADWRDRLKPQMPIWVTETGYDVGGPIGRTERDQAAKLPRSTMMALANGIEKVFLYRIAGSTPAHHGGSGLIRNDSSLRASYFTMATLIRQLDGVTASRTHRLRTEDTDLWLYYWRTPKGDMLSAHTPDGAVPLGLDLGRCEVTDAFGSTKEMDIKADFQVGEFPVYIRHITNQSLIDLLLDQAIQREINRREKLAFLAKAQPYLFDFGTHEQVGTMKVGTIRSFMTVTKEDAYDAAKGYGFIGTVSGKNFDAGWIKSLLEKDSIQLHRPATFRIDAEPGVYLFQFKAIKYRDGGQLIVNGAKEGRAEVSLPMDNDSAPTEPVTLTVAAGQAVEIELPPSQVQWLTLIPQFQE